MSYQYLLDTNVVSDLVRNPDGDLAVRVGGIPDDAICTSIIVVAELRFGVAKRRSMRLSKQLEAVLEGIDILPFEAPADQAYATLRTHLERTGQPIGANDMLIAAHALALGCTLVTANEREFSRVAGLRIENWRRPNPE